MSFTKKDKEENSPVIPPEKQFTGSSVERNIIQNVAICMNSMHITKAPVLMFLNNDQEIFEGVYQSHINNPKIEIIKETYGEEMYLKVLACHAFGAGVYVTLCQETFKKPVEQFTPNEIMQISSAFHQTDPYELALKTLGFALDSNNKRCLDQIALVGVGSYKEATESKALNKDYLKSLMQVMFNAGVTLIYRD